MPTGRWPWGSDRVVGPGNSTITEVVAHHLVQNVLEYRTTLSSMDLLDWIPQMVELGEATPPKSASRTRCLQNPERRRPERGSFAWPPLIALHRPIGGGEGGGGASSGFHHPGQCEGRARAHRDQTPLGDRWAMATGRGSSMSAVVCMAYVPNEPFYHILSHCITLL